MQNTTVVAQLRPATSSVTAIGETASSAPRPCLQDFWLWILLVGPLVAPFFVWLGWGVLHPFADAIYFLGDLICPKEDAHLIFLGNPMAVCSSCWAAVLGLWAIRLLYGRSGEGIGPLSRFQQPISAFWARWQTAPVSVQLRVLAAGFLPWAFDVLTWDLGIWSSPQPYMLFAGFLGGLAAGAILLPAASEMRTRLARERRGPSAG